MKRRDFLKLSAALPALAAPVLADGPRDFRTADCVVKAHGLNSGDGVTLVSQAHPGSIDQFTEAPEIELDPASLETAEVEATCSPPLQAQSARIVWPGIHKYWGEHWESHGQ